MKNTTKLERVKKYLDERNIAYRVPKRAGQPVHSDLVIPDYGIYVKITCEADQAYWERHHGYRKNPVFIRDTDTPKFVIEKIENTIIKAMTLMQAAWMKKNCK